MMFIERVKKRVSKAREACAEGPGKICRGRKEEDDLEDGERRLDALFRMQIRQQNFFRLGHHPQCPRISRPSWGELRASVQDEMRSDGRSEQREKKHMRSLPSNTLDLVPPLRASSAGSTIVDHVQGTLGGQSA